MLGDGQDYETKYIQQILPSKLALDLWYIDHWSLTQDFQILVLTFLQVLLKSVNTRSLLLGE